MKTISVYPLGNVKKPSSFCDILRKGEHITCIVSLTHEDAIDEGIKKECVVWDRDGFPDVYVKDKTITLIAIKRGLRLLEKDPRNKFRYRLKNHLRNLNLGLGQ